MYTYVYARRTSLKTLRLAYTTAARRHDALVGAPSHGRELGADARTPLLEVPRGPLDRGLPRPRPTHRHGPLCTIEPGALVHPCVRKLRRRDRVASGESVAREGVINAGVFRGLSEPR